MNRTHDFKSYQQRQLYTPVKDGPGYYDMAKVNFDLLMKRTHQQVRFDSNNFKLSPLKWDKEKVFSPNLNYGWETGY